VKALPFAAFVAWAALAVWAVAASAQPTETACRKTTFEGAAFTVCRYDAAKDELRLALHDRKGKPLGSLAAVRKWLGADASRALFAMNAGMYEKDRRPVGLFVERGRVVRPLNTATGSGNFYLLPNGVFWTTRDGTPHIDETAIFAEHKPKAWRATQSGPLLVEHGVIHPKISPNGTSELIRNGVGVHGREALFVISDAPVSFGRFARFFHDGLGCEDALYLDGTVSALWAPELGREDPRDGLGTFVVVLRRRS
jgi:uncharacterized protein YigE (DUF2233 family)